jgi:hypothetical protein
LRRSVEVHPKVARHHAEVHLKGPGHLGSRRCHRGGYTPALQGYFLSAARWRRQRAALLASWAATPDQAKAANAVDGL